MEKFSMYSRATDTDSIHSAGPCLSTVNKISLYTCSVAKDLIHQAGSQFVSHILADVCNSNGHLDVRHPLKL